MRIIFPVLLLSWVLVGCGVDARPAAEAPEPAPQAKVIALPTETPGTKIGLIHEGATLQVGMTAEEGSRMFPRPEKATLVSELPEGWPKDYGSSGWQAEKEGFGMILHDEKVVGALHSEEGIRQSDIDGVFNDYATLYKDWPVDKYWERADKALGIYYWIWEDGDYRCMICETKNAKAQLAVTVGMGYIQIMDALRMSKEAAAVDIEAAKKLQATAKG